MAGIWRKTLIYLGLVEDDEVEDLDREEPEREQSRGRRIAAADGNGRRSAVIRPVPSPAARFHLVHPSSFNDAQELGDKYREGYSVLINLQGVDDALGRRVVDFASGLAYGLAGSMQPVAERVYLLTPSGVQVSAEERRRFLEERGFFNQA